MAEDLAPATPDAEPLLVRRRADDEPRVFRARFAIAYLVLAVAAGVALGAAVLLVDRPETAAGAPWSSWKPTGTESSWPRQIADYVGGRYRLETGAPMVFILADAPQVQDVPVRNIAIQNDPADDSDISIVPIDEDKSVMYNLCGGGARCSIPEGQPTQERLQLLRREALELALYTFKYADIDAVIATLPPESAEEGTEQTSGTALFFRRGEFSSELRNPLRRTLLTSERPGTEIISIEGPTIDRLTKSRTYGFVFTQAQEGSAIMILAPLQ